MFLQQAGYWHIAYPSIRKMKTPIVNVGIMQEKALSFVFHGEYVLTETGEFMVGEQHVLFFNGHIAHQGKMYQDMVFMPASTDAYFELKAVTIGQNFHWQRKENQCFKGSLNLLINENKILVINQVDVEEYLTSVISSEMSAQASKELLKAHAVISRSWLLAQIGKNDLLTERKEKQQSYIQEENRLIRWYDREDHTLFDVCADDHCQRYQGITRASTPIVREVIQETRGEILISEGEICDARFSKCCGGVTEQFEHCWEPTPHAYLIALRDYTDTSFPDLTQEVEAEKWIRSAPEAFCHTNDKTILSQVLNNYDQETTDFYRWQVTYTQTELAELIHRKSGMDFGEIIDLIPIRRGKSGRIEELKIVGTRRSFIIGKELEIRRTLSESHLYSSAFVVDKENIQHDIPERFILIGAGWGHGVGLCQIGAAMMSTAGYHYHQILSHYYPGTSIEKRY